MSVPEISRAERRTLEALLAAMIPMSEEYGVPGADDPAIVEDILATAGGELSEIVQGLRGLEELSGSRHRDPFCALDESAKRSLIDDFKTSQGRFVHTVVAITVQCYYRDARVMEALGMEVRAPYPQGFTLEQGDWGLLDPVRQRPKLYRDVPS